MRDTLSVILAAVMAAFVAPAASAARSEIGNPRLMQGPMIGAVTDSEILVWARASGRFDCMLVYSPEPDLSQPQYSTPVTAQKSSDYTVVLRMTHLKPDTAYYYTVYVNGQVAGNLNHVPPFRCKTAPAPREHGLFRVAFGSCPRVYTDWEQPIWRAVENFQPDLFFWIGDNIYGDALDPDILAEEYRRQRDVPSLQPLLRSVPQLAIWDDHDYGLNDHDRENPIKDDALRVFKQYWANPAYGSSDAPGVFFVYSYGGVDFFFLDCRYHRAPNADPDGPNKTFLGKAQLAWLKRELKSSRAPFKILVSGSGWTKAKGAGGDSWASFLHERDELFNYIRDATISGIVLLSGDTHVGELNCVPWSETGGYDLYDLVSSPLAQQPSGGAFGRYPEVRIRPAVTNTPNAGIIEFDMRREPTLRFNLISIYGRTLWEDFELRADELVNGVASWPAKMDPAERERYQRYHGGGAYYE